MQEERKQFVTAEVVRSGEKIILPERMDLKDVRDVITQKMQYEEEKVTFQETFPCFPWDGAIALKAAMNEKFGVAMARKQMKEGFFGPMPVMPSEIQVSVGVDETVSVPWGRFQIATSDGDDYIDTAYDYQNGMVCFQMAGVIRRKFLPIIRDLAKMVRDHLRLHSIYRGKALSLKFFDEDGERMDIPEINFWKGDTRVAPIFSKEVEERIEANIYTPLRFRQACIDAGIPFKRGALLSGPYGTGKTLVATQVAQYATRAGITFIYLENVSELTTGLKFAKQYAPCVIFAEDVDRATAGGRTPELDSILNSIDGVDSKNDDIMVVLTTNHLTTINAAMLRPGRLDVIIDVKPPDAEAAARLVRAYAGKLLSRQADMESIGAALAGQIPAFIRETVERSKLVAVSRTGKAPIQGDLLESDIVGAASTMEEQRRLLEEGSRKKPLLSPNEKAALLIADGLRDVANVNVLGRTITAHSSNGYAHSTPELPPGANV